MNCDNQGAIVLSKDHKFRIPFHLGGSQRWKVLVVYIPTDENLANVKFQHFVKLLRLHTIQSNDHVKGSVEVL